MSERLLSNQAGLLKRTVLVLSAFSLAMYLLLGLMAFINGQNWLPFGWKVNVIFSARTVSGKVPSLSQMAVQRELFSLSKNPEESRFISFKTRIFSQSDTEYLFFLADPRKARIRCNGKPARINIDQHRQKIEMDKGWNEIEVRYAPLRRGWPEKFSFYLRFFQQVRTVSSPLPYYHYILPDSSLSKNLGHVIPILNHLKSLGFILSLMLLTVVFLKKTGPSRDQNLPLSQAGNLPYLIFEYFMLALAVLFSVAFLNNRLHLKLPHWLIWVASLAVPAGHVFKALKERISFKIPLDKVWALVLISVLVFGFVFVISGKPFPLEPIGSGDIDRHLALVNHFIEFNDIRTDYRWELYPQAFHASLAMLSDVLNIPPEKIITLLLAMTFVLVYFLIYLLTRYFFPETRLLLFFLVAIMANSNFIMRTVFDFYFFPPIVSICFFLAGLLFFLKERRIPSSLSFAVSLIVYPYFMGIFGIVMLFVFLNRITTSTLPLSGKIGQFCLYFLVPALFSAIYIYVFLTFGFQQQQQGFFTYFKLNPFSALRSPHSFAILLGISYLFSDIKKNRAALFLTFGTLFGFLAYYLPYYFFNIGSTYYLIKNITFVMLLAIIPETFFLHYIIAWLKKSVKSRRSAAKRPDR